MVCKGSKIAPPAVDGGANLFANRILSKQMQKLKWDPAKSLSAIKVPTMIVRGSCDFLSPGNAELYGKYLGSSVVTLDGVGHGFLENRAKVDAAFTAFATGPLSAVP
jgi:pimeloyl-ACP methyl ester carboxylesterase